jgi:hypothetical protein
MFLSLTRLFERATFFILLEMDYIQEKILELTKTVCHLDRSERINELSIQTLNEKGLGGVSITFVEAICDQFMIL